MGKLPLFETRPVVHLRPLRLELRRLQRLPLVAPLLLARVLGELELLQPGLGVGDEPPLPLWARLDLVVEPKVVEAGVVLEVTVVAVEAVAGHSRLEGLPRVLRLAVLAFDRLAQQRVRRPDEALRAVGTALSERGACGGMAVARTSNPL